MGRVVSKPGQIGKSESLIRCAQEQERAIFDTITALEKFANEPALTGDAYDNAKGYVQTVLVPVNKALFRNLEKEVSANKRVISCCNNHLSGTTLLNEDAITDEIRRLQGMIRSLQDMAFNDPMGLFGEYNGNSMMIDMYNSRIAQMRKQLEKLNAFDAATQRLHSAVYAQMKETQRNMTSTFSAVSFSRGRFHYSDVDLSWAAAAVAAWESSPRVQELREEYLFRENLKSEFGFDDETVILMMEVYDSLRVKYPDATQAELDWRFARLMGGFEYNTAKSFGPITIYIWDETAGIATEINGEKVDEQYYYVHFLGLDPEEYKRLRDAVKLQYDIAGGNYSKLPEGAAGYVGKADFAHQMITTSTILGEKLGKIHLAIFGGVLKGEQDLIWDDEKVVEKAGWLGDATLKNKDTGRTSFGPDDYNADLDARNIATYMQEKGLSLTAATNLYYSDLAAGKSRADIFLEDTPLNEVKGKIFYDLVYSEYIEAANNLQFIKAGELLKIMSSEELMMQWIKENQPDSYDFIRSLEAGASEMITNAP